jgi:hypothetical protein
MKGRYQSVKRTVVDNIKFASKKEAARYQELKLLVSAGEIAHLTLQHKIPIEIGGVQVMMRSTKTKHVRQLTYICDFRYLDMTSEEFIIEDVKGHATDVYRIKRALVEAMGYRIKET